MSATVNAKAMRAVLGVANAAGLDAGAMARAHGVAGALTDVDARFPYSRWIALWQEIVDRTGRETLGIDAAESLPWGHWDVVDYLIGTSDTWGAALKRFERYFAIISTGVRHVFEFTDGEVRIIRRYAAGCETRLLAPAEFGFATTIAHLRMAVGFHYCPKEVAFAAPPPRSDARHRRFFGCPVRFDALESVIVMDASALTMPMCRKDSELGRVLERHADSLVKELDGDRDFVSHVRRAILDGLADANVSVVATARQLAMSVRTLQRRLREHGVTFDELCDQTRADLARRYLDDSALSIQETAHLLAFGDLRGFYRAFKRWEGRTPAAYRQRERREEAGARRP